MEPLSKHIERFLTLRNSKNFILVRHGQSMANMSGSINGWTDVRLSYKGREQANNLLPHFLKFVNKFDGVYSSDLERAMESANLALGFPTNLIKTDRRLREMYFGLEEGNHFDSLPEEQKNKINSLDYEPKGGETWPIAKARALDFFSGLKDGNYLVFTHGGLMCALTTPLGITDILPNCSCIGLRINAKNNLPDHIHFKWVYEESKTL